MPEIKHTFQGGKMNKDLDERLVPNGQYRDAMNIQVRTTDGQVGSNGENVGLGDAGTVQNIMGTGQIGSSIQPGSSDSMHAVASIAYEKNDVAYFFFACNTDIPDSSSDITSQTIYYDNIVEQHINGTTTPVVVDRFAVTSTYANAGSPTFNTNGVSFDVTDGTLYRVGMVVTALDSNDSNLIPGAIINSISGNTITLLSQTDPVTWTFNNCVALIFEIPEEDRLLKFKKDNNITGVNVIDDLLFWTDNLCEPKKINITRCKAGTTNFNTHTKLMVEDPLSLNAELVEVSDLEFAGINTDLKEEHITVIRKAPKTAPTLHMDARSESSTEAEITTTDLSEVVNGDIITINNDNLSATLFRAGDIIKLTENIEEEGVTPGIIKVTFISYIADDLTETLTPTNVIKVEVISVNEEVGVDSLTWSTTVELTKPLFELKFARFGYRYKYEDGEYSSFSPFSELAFLPAPYDYEVKKGYNLGMVNTVRELVIKDFIPWIGNRPHDVSAVEILYKTTDSPNVYTVKTIEREKDAEWELYTFNGETGQLKITSEMIHQVLPSNQILRSWDNVPRYAQAQEISANRLIYGNYIQGYNLKTSPGLIQSISSDDTATLFTPQKSVKSIRNYKFGLVFGDKYGRETPVISTGYSIENTIDGVFDTLTGDILVEKQLAKFANRFTLKQDWSKPSTMEDGAPETWMDYVKYYVKETTNEYYNLVLDRWYNAEDGNIWLSFPSADRNKLDEETYLILKNGHGNQTPVEEAARYKVIAIDNEAPDFIKITRKLMGMVQLEEADVFTTANPDNNAQAPQTLTQGNKISISGANWNNFLGNYNNKGELKMRVVGRTMNITGTDAVIVNEIRSNRWVTVTHFVQDSSASPVSGEVYWDELIGTDADMFAQFTAANLTLADNTNDLTYFLEFKQEIVENKPEFDGRFFVLIERDLIVQENIMKQVATQQNLEVEKSYLVSYIDTTLVNPAMFGGFMNYKWGENSNEGLAFLSNASSDTEKQDRLNSFGMGMSPAPDVEANNPLNTYATPLKIHNTTSQGAADYWDNLNNVYFESQLNAGVKVTKIFLDGARAAKFKISDPNQVGNDYTINDGDIDGGRRIFGYKPTALDQGGATSGLGRMIFSRQDRHTATPVAYRSLEDAVNDSNPYGVGFQAHFNTPGTIFRFAADTSNNGQPHLYKTVNLNPQNQLADFAAQEGNNNNAFVKNHSALSDDNIQNDSVPGMSDDQTYWGAANDPTPGGSNWTGYGGVGPSVVINDAPWTSAAGVAWGIGAFLSSNQVTTPSSNYVDSVGILQDGSGNPLVNSSVASAKRSYVRFEFRRLDENGDLTTEGIDVSSFDPRGLVQHDGVGQFEIQVINFSADTEGEDTTTNGAVWETEPKEDVNLDLYYEATQGLPMVLTQDNWSAYAPFNCNIKVKSEADDGTLSLVDLTLPTSTIDFGADGALGGGDDTTILTPTLENFKLNNAVFTNTGMSVRITHNVIGSSVDVANTAILVGQYITFIHNDGLETTTKVLGFTDSSGNVSASATGYYSIDTEVWKYAVKLSWFNCYSFGNAVESDRIRDDFNAPQIDNGVKVSTTISGYKQETKGSGMIYSGIYNSTSGVNDLNEFNMSEKITKDLNPSYGSIQALKTRDRDVVVFTEDKTLKVLSNKDAVFNADGNPQLVATNRVLGEAIPFVGEYGISKDPDSLAVDNYRMYFTDKQRGAVLRLSMDGLTPISNVGMKSWFRKNLKTAPSILGTFDKVSGEYNVTLGYNPSIANDLTQFTQAEQTNIANRTVSFNEGGKGWVSFKSFIPQAGESVGGKYLTTNADGIYQHNVEILDANLEDTNRNKFYGAQTSAESTLTVLFNDIPGTVKSFKTLNYEGTQSKVDQFTTVNTTDAANNPLSNLSDGEFYNLSAKHGWYVESFETDQFNQITNPGQGAHVPEFINKENKWFNKITGTLQPENEMPSNMDTSEFTVQGIGIPTASTTPVQTDFTLTVQNDPDN